jgi:hypothetical protein
MNHEGSIAECRIQKSFRSTRPPQFKHPPRIYLSGRVVPKCGSKAVALIISQLI